jgi:hypothetical protein
METQAMDQLAHLGIGGMFAMMVIDKVMGFLKREKKEGFEIGNCRNCRSEELLGKLSDSSIRQTEILSRLVDDSQDVKCTCIRIETKLNGYKLGHHGSYKSEE